MSIPSGSKCESQLGPFTTARANNAVSPPISTKPVAVPHRCCSGLMIILCSRHGCLTMPATCQLNGLIEIVIPVEAALFRCLKRKKRTAARRRSCGGSHPEWIWAPAQEKRLCPRVEVSVICTKGWGASAKQAVAEVCRQSQLVPSGSIKGKLPTDAWCLVPVRCGLQAATGCPCSRCRCPAEVKWSEPSRGSTSVWCAFNDPKSWPNLKVRKFRHRQV